MGEQDSDAGILAVTAPVHIDSKRALEPSMCLSAFKLIDVANVLYCMSTLSH